MTYIKREWTVYPIIIRKCRLKVSLFILLLLHPFIFYYLHGSKHHIIQKGKRKKSKKYAKEQNKKSKNKYKQLQFNFYVYKST